MCCVWVESSLSHIPVPKLRDKNTEQKACMDLRLAYCLKPRPPPKVEEGSGFETCMYRCTSGELKMKFVAQNYAVLMGFEGLCLNEAKYQQMASCTHQFAESVAF